MACVAAGAADALRDGVEVCGLARGWSEIAGLACLLALAPEQVLGHAVRTRGPGQERPRISAAGGRGTQCWDFVFESRLPS